MSCIASERDQELASQLADCLSIHYPDGQLPTNDDGLVAQWLRELSNGLSRRCLDGKDNDKSSSLEETTHEIMKLAIELWKSRDTSIMDTITGDDANSKSAATSFSLLDQFDMNPQPRIFWQDIQKAKNEQERLLLLQKVDHVDDLAPDWNQVNLVLRQGLANHQRALDYVELHQKWFNQCNATAEYQNLRQSLERNLLQAIQQHFDQYQYVTSASSPMALISFPPQLQIAFQMFQAWQYMWMTIIQQTGGDDDGNDNEMKSILKLLLQASDSTPNNSLVLLPAHLLALVDSHLHWFQHWAQHLAPLRLSQVMEPFIREFLKRCQCQCRVAAATPETASATLTVVQLDGESNSDEGATLLQLQNVLYLQSLSILESVLVHTRVLTFPWKALVKQTAATATTPTSPLPDQSLTLFQVFLQPLNSGNEQTVDTCVRGIETLLCGSYRNALVFGQMLSKFQEELASSSDSLRERLHSILSDIHHSVGASSQASTLLGDFLKVLGSKE